MNWQKERISSFTEVTTGGTPSTDKREFWDGGKIPWLNSGDLNQGIVTKASNFITEEGYKSSSTKMMPPNTVLIALTGATTGLTALLKIEACANQSVTGIFPSERHHPEFLYYFFRTQRERILKAAWGGAQPHINQKYVKDYIVPIPPIIDQIKIATILTKVETLINLRKENITHLDSFLTSTFFKMFGDPVRNEKGWQVDALENLVATDCPLTYGIVQPGEDFPNGTPVIRPVDLTHSHITRKGLKLIDPKISDKFKRTLLKGNEILMCVRGTTGIVAYATEELEGCNVTRGITPIWFDEKFEKLFAYFLFKSAGVQKEIARYTYGATLQQINLSDLRKLNLINPPLSSQKEFVAIAQKCEDLKKYQALSLEYLENLYNSLSQKAFKGELDLSELEINHIIPVSIGGKTDISNLEVVPKKENKKIADKQLKEDKRYGDPFEVDEATAKKQGAQFYREWKKLHPKPKKSKITWAKVSTQEVANWVKENYTGYHFTSEMLIRFLMEEHITQPDYYSSEELKKYPQTNEADDLKSFVFSAINKQNPFLQLEQVFYDAEAENLQLNVTEEDFELIKERSPKERSGIYFTIVE